MSLYYQSKSNKCLWSPSLHANNVTFVLISKVVRRVVADDEMEPIKGRVKKFFPILSWIGDYNLSKGIQDLLAGSTVGLLVIPQGIAFATIAGLPPQVLLFSSFSVKIISMISLQYGLYSAFMSSFAYMIFGTVPSVVIGPTTLMALMCFPFTSTNVANAPILSLLTGIIITLCGAFQFGFLLDFVSTPVISGFTTAASITIASSQLKNLLGINVTEKASDWWPGILHTYANIGLNLPSWNWSDALLGFTCMLILIGLRSLQNPLAIDGNFGKVLRLFIGSRNVIVVLSATIFAFTVETPLSLTGQIETGLPSISLPLYGLTNDFWSHIKSLGSVIISLPLISALSHVAVAKSFSRGQKLDANQELLAVGLCNILGSFVWAMPVSGSFNRTAVNRASGAQTTFGGLFSGTIVLSALHFMMPFCAYIPKSSLAAIIVSSIIFNIDIAIFSTLWKISSNIFFHA